MGHLLTGAGAAALTKVLFALNEGVLPPTANFEQAAAGMELEGSPFRVLRQPGVGVDHYARAFLALATAMRYEVDADAAFLRPARLLLDVASANRAEILGIALRLAYTLSAGTADLLAGTSLSLSGGQLVLRLEEDTGVFAGESVLRRLDRLAQALGLEAATEAVAARAA